MIPVSVQECYRIMNVNILTHGHPRDQLSRKAGRFEVCTIFHDPLICTRSAMPVRNRGRSIYGDQDCFEPADMAGFKILQEKTVCLDHEPARWGMIHDLGDQVTPHQRFSPVKRDAGIGIPFNKRIEIIEIDAEIRGKRRVDLYVPAAPLNIARVDLSAAIAAAQVTGVSKDEMEEYHECLPPRKSAAIR